MAYQNCSNDDNLSNFLLLCGSIGGIAGGFALLIALLKREQ